jgi:hypothetical protein
LPCHHEQGEEAFVVWVSPDETVRFEIEAFSRPGDPLVRLSGPIGRGIQKGRIAGYLRALKHFVDEDAGMTHNTRASCEQSRTVARCPRSPGWVVSPRIASCLATP